MKTDTSVLENGSLLNDQPIQTKDQSIQVKDQSTQTESIEELKERLISPTNIEHDQLPKKRTPSEQTKVNNLDTHHTYSYY